MNIRHTVITTLLLISGVASLTGCVSSKTGNDILPQGTTTMADIYNQQSSGDTGYAPGADDFRQKVAYNPIHYRHHHRAVHHNVTEDDTSIPRRLPNPEISIYVYPHFSNDNQNYVPGHRAYTQLYSGSHFALPGEATILE